LPDALPHSALPSLLPFPLPGQALSNRCDNLFDRVLWENRGARTRFSAVVCLANIVLLVSISPALP
jgi:hypothetical protein